MELPPLGIYKLECDNFQNCVLFPWQPLDDHSEQLKQLKIICNLDIYIKPSLGLRWYHNEVGITQVFVNIY